MVSLFLPSKSRFAFERTVDTFQPNRKGHVYLWTFTFAEVLPVAEARKRWGVFLARLNKARKRRQADFSGVRVFELHPGGHGLHVHVLTTCYWWVGRIRRLWKRAGGGRVHALPISWERRYYVGKYLSKARRPSCLKGARLWQAFGEVDAHKISDVKIESNWTRIYYGLKAALGKMWDRMRWFQRCQAVGNVERMRPWNWSLPFQHVPCDDEPEMTFFPPLQIEFGL